MKAFVYVDGKDAIKHEHALRQILDSIPIHENCDIDISYKLILDDFGSLPRIHKNLCLLRALMENGLIEKLEIEDADREAWYYLDCIRDEIEKIRKDHG